MLTPCNTIRGCLLDSERPNFWNPEKGKDCMLYHNLLDNYTFYDIYTCIPFGNKSAI